MKNRVTRRNNSSLLRQMIAARTVTDEILCLGVTILLSLTVFLNMVAETMPATSDAVPLLGKMPTALLLEAERRDSQIMQLTEFF